MLTYVRVLRKAYFLACRYESSGLHLHHSNLQVGRERMLLILIQLATILTLLTVDLLLLDLREVQLDGRGGCCVVSDSKW